MSYSDYGGGHLEYGGGYSDFDRGYPDYDGGYPLGGSGYEQYDYGHGMGYGGGFREGSDEYGGRGGGGIGRGAFNGRGGNGFGGRGRGGEFGGRVGGEFGGRGGGEFGGRGGGEFGGRGGGEFGGRGGGEFGRRGGGGFGGRGGGAFGGRGSMGRGSVGGPGRGRGRGGSRGFDQDGDLKMKLTSISICVDFIRGDCQKGNKCPKPHVDYVESVVERELLSKVKFCHDFQNRGECSRVGCKFLHVTREEDQDFLSTGSIPSAVFGRMQQMSVMDDPNYTGFGPESEGRGRGRGGRGRGRGRGRGGLGAKRPFEGADRDASKFSRGAGSRGGRGGGRGKPGGLKHSSSLPVTFGDICVDHLKGSCLKGSDCQLKHYDSIVSQDQRTGLVACVFCHDFQNGKCMREYCKYIHASRHEETFFMDNGYFPPSLVARNKTKLFFSDICLDYLRSQCIRGTKCFYRHVDRVDSEDERQCLSRSIFCHDFQNGMCVRDLCKMIHTSKQDEEYFLQTGCFPKGVNANPKGAGKVQTDSLPNLSHIADNVCREFVKNLCFRGNSCKFYHPNKQELEVLLSQPGSAMRGGRGRGCGMGSSRGGQNNTPVSAGPVGAGFGNEQVTSGSFDPGESIALKSRVNQLEQLLADACQFMNMTSGDQNPAMSSLMQSIGKVAPDSALANQPGYSGMHQ